MHSIQRARREFKLARAKLAARAGMGNYRLWEIESGRKRATLAEEVALRRALGAVLMERVNNYYAMWLEEVGR